MKKNSFFFIFSICLVSFAQIPGGWVTLDLKNMDADLKKAANFAISEIKKNYKENRDIIKIESARSHVIAGIEYDIIFLFPEETRYEAKVWRQPAGYNGPNENFIVTWTSVCNSLGESIPGGWSKLNLKSLDNEAKKALDYALLKMNEQLKDFSPKLLEIKSAAFQIVAGINYRFVLDYMDSSLGINDFHEYEALVWRKVGNNNEEYEFSVYSLTRGLSQKTLGAPLEGGWNILDLENLNIEAKKALDFGISGLKNILKDHSPKLLKVRSAYYQIVAGINYRFVLDFMDSSLGINDYHQYEAIVWRKIGENNGEYELTVHSLTRGLPEINMVINGGWANLNIENLDESSQKALDIAVDHVKTLLQGYSPQLSKIQKAQSQVVAGIQYKFELVFITAQDDMRFIKVYETTVWRKPPGFDGPQEKFEVSSANEISPQ